jgi:hypothetical protein
MPCTRLLPDVFECGIDEGDLILSMLLIVMADRALKAASRFAGPGKRLGATRPFGRLPE